MAGGPSYTVREVEFLATLWAEGVRSNEEIYDEYKKVWPEGRSFSAIAAAKTKHEGVRRRIKEIRGETDTARPSPEDVARHLSGEVVPGVSDQPIVHTEVEPGYHDTDRLWESRKTETSRAIQYHDQRHRARIGFPGTKPIALAFISDQHISEGTPSDLAQMERDAILVRDTPGMYGVLGGDGVDNHIKHRTAIIASGSKPGNEWRLYDHYLGFFGHKLAAMISGNHDDWTKDFTDVDVVGMIARKHRIFYAPDYVLLDVEVGKAVYKVKVRHQYRFSSSLNETHTVKRMWSEDGDDFDVGVVCHKHVAALEPFEKHGLVRWALRPGSYQFMSGYSRRFGYTQSLPTCPTMVFLPDRREMHGFRDVRWAASYLTWLRNGWPETGALLAAE
jgi:hypothetical protein